MSFPVPSIPEIRFVNDSLACEHQIKIDAADERDNCLQGVDVLVKQITPDPSARSLDEEEEERHIGVTSECYLLADVVKLLCNRNIA